MTVWWVFKDVTTKSTITRQIAIEHQGLRNVDQDVQSYTKRYTVFEHTTNDPPIAFDWISQPFSIVQRIPIDYRGSCDLLVRILPQFWHVWFESLVQHTHWTSSPCIFICGSFDSCLTNMHHVCQQLHHVAWSSPEASTIQTFPHSSRKLPRSRAPDWYFALFGLKHESKTLTLLYSQSSVERWNLTGSCFVSMRDKSPSGEWRVNKETKPAVSRRQNIEVKYSRMIAAGTNPIS